MADPVVETLTTLAQAFSVQKTPGPGPHSFVLQLLRPGNPDDRLTIVENLIETVIKNANLDISWLLKDVRFATPPITDDAPVGGQPIISLLTPNITNGAIAPPGVAGIIATLGGTVPIPVQETVAKPLDVAFDVQWSVVDEHGNPASDLSWTLGGAQGQGGNIPLQVGQAALPLSLSFLPVVVELVPNLALTAKRTIRISLRLTATAGGAFRATSGWVDLPPLDVILPVIPVPTIAIFFSGAFGAHTLIAVPGSSPLEEGSFMPALDRLNSLLGTLDPALQLGGLFVSSLGDIKHALANNATKLVFRKGDACAQLRNVRFEDASIWDWNGEDGDDHFASMMMIGPPNRSVDCFNEEQLHSGEGQMTLSVDKELHAAVADLGSKNPPSNPPGRVTVPHEPNGWNWGRARWVDEFKNELSSYRFGWV